MEFKENDYFPPEREDEAPTHTPPEPDFDSVRQPEKKRIRFSFGTLISVVCIVAAIAVLLTFVVTNNANKHYYSQELARQQEVIDQLKENGFSTTETDFEELDLLSKLFKFYSYYAGKVSEEELITAVMKAYAAATGDDYAEYYTEEEYNALTADREGEHVGIGVSVIQTTVNVSGQDYAVLQIISIYQNGPSASSDLRVGDCIYAVKTETGYQSVTALGYTEAISRVQGEKGTQAEFAIFRLVGSNYENLEISITRNTFESQSVTYRHAENDASVGIIHISSFDLTTPHQLKAAVQALQGAGVTHFIFDVRNNPGGDLQSIKATMTYFLQKGDLILSAIDRNGKVAKSYYAEPMQSSDEYAACNVAESEIGMFANLDMVVLCNEYTASAAEVFTATMRDYGLATIVGETTFGKGIMQSYFPMSAFGNYKGYVKMTTYAYVTKCGITYHEVGIEPNSVVPLSEEAKQYNFYVLPQALDNQLQAAIAQFQ